MKRTSLSIAGVSTLLIATSLTAATAADMATKAPPPTAVTGPVVCSSLWDFLDTSCPLSWYGITIYGTVDAGVTWQSHGTPYNGSIPAGAEYLIQKNSNRARPLSGTLLDEWKGSIKNLPIFKGNVFGSIRWLKTMDPLLTPKHADAFEIRLTHTETVLPQVLTATISDQASVMLLAKYTNGSLKLYAGYEWIQFMPPSNPQTAFNDLTGDFLCLGCAVINNTNIINTGATQRERESRSRIEVCGDIPQEVYGSNEPKSRHG